LASVEVEITVSRVSPAGDHYDQFKLRVTI